MSLALVRSRAPASGRAPAVTVEVHLANGLPSFSIVGLPDLEVRESRERVRAALQNCGFEFPVRRITVNLAPADLPKESGRFDLPIALGILAANGQLPAEALHGREFAGELSLTGALRPMRGAFAMACGTARSGARRARRVAEAVTTADDASAQNDPDLAHENPPRPAELYLPAPSAREAALVPNVDVYGATDLPSLCAHLAGEPDAKLYPVTAVPAGAVREAELPDMRDVIGQRGARRAPARPAAADDRRRGADLGRAAVREPRRLLAVAVEEASVPRAAPLVERRGAGRWAQSAAAGRDHARPSRRPVPR